jgi:hypothetical protein
MMERGSILWLVLAGVSIISAPSTLSGYNTPQKLGA